MGVEGCGYVGKRAFWVKIKDIHRVSGGFYRVEVVDNSIYWCWAEGDVWCMACRGLWEAVKGEKGYGGIDPSHILKGLLGTIESVLCLFSIFMVLHDLQLDEDRLL
ncbi:hypothetical protein [Paenibacillus sp. GCM10027629]|uniref:hypothetical protein n=1 Tax=Paenibacillus sp. GCM10027629 TaxID=3273414 RepID=UPI0036D3EE7D